MRRDSNRTKNPFVMLCSLIYLIGLALLTFSPFVGYMPILEKTSWLVLAVIIAVSFFFDFSYYTSRSFIYLFLYFLIVFFNSQFGDAVFNNWISAFMELFLLLAPCVICYHALKNNNYIFANIIVVLILVIIIIEAISTSVLEEINSSIIRQVYHESLEANSNEILYPFYRLGMSNYLLPHAVPIVIPPIIMVVKSKGTGIIKRIFYFASLLAIFALIFLSGSSTALILGFLGLFASLITIRSNSLKKQKYMLLFIVIMLPVVLSTQLKVTILDGIGSLVEDNHYFHDKIEEFKYATLYGEASGDMGERQNLYNESLNKFGDNILLGTDGEVGEHSAFLDRLALLGVVGIIPLIAFFVVQIKKYLPFIKKENRFYYYEGVFIGIMLLLLKNMDVWEVYLMLFTLLPIMMCVSLEKRVDDNIERNK